MEKTIIDRCVRLVYQEYLANPDPAKMPILQDLYALMRKQTETEAQRIANNRKEMAYTVFTSTYTDEINVIHKYEDVKESLYFPLIKYLVRNKHIDENYPDYMSYFYEQNLSMYPARHYCFKSV